MALTLTGRAAGQPFSEGVDAPWSFRESGGICILERAVQDFGTVRFSAVPGGPLRLEILGHRDVFAAGALKLYRVAPPWHEEHPRRQALGEAQGRAGSGILVGEPLATQVLMTLYQGYEAHVRHAAWYGGEADVRIGNVHLRAHYETFAGCLRGIEAAGWAQLERSRIGYPSGAVGLDDEARLRLRQLADYVLNDPAVTRIFIDGHTDNVGTPRSNHALSRQRAEQVAAFFRGRGVAEARLVVRYHGARYPVADNGSDAARAENRRTTVRLERNWQGELANR